MKIFRSQPYYRERGAMCNLEDFSDHEGKLAFMATENLWYADRVKAKLFYTQLQLRNLLMNEGQNPANERLNLALEELKINIEDLNTLEDLIYNREKWPWYEENSIEEG